MLVAALLASLKPPSRQADVLLMPVSVDDSGVALSDVYGRPALTGAGVRVAVVDTGVDYTHPDLRDRVRVLVSFTVTTSNGDPVVFIVGVNGSLSDALSLDRWFKQVTGSYAWLDEHGHGTHVAGIIAGTGVASGGRYAGLAPGAELWVVKVLGRDGTGSVETLCKALEWLAGQNVDIVNLALGFRSAEVAASVQSSIRKLVSSGKVVVAAVGNSGVIGAVEYPARLEEVYAVAAVDRMGFRAPFSAMGMPGSWKPDFAALGVRVVSTLPTYPCTLSKGASIYGALSGTSMATATASGLLALWVEAVGRDAVRKRDFIASHAVIPASPVSYKTLVIGYGVLLPPQP